MNKTTDNIYDGEDEMLESALADTNESEAAMFNKPADNNSNAQASQRRYDEQKRRLAAHSEHLAKADWQTIAIQQQQRAEAAEAQRDAAVAALRAAEDKLDTVNEDYDALKSDTDQFLIDVKAALTSDTPFGMVAKIKAAIAAAKGQ